MTGGWRLVLHKLNSVTNQHEDAEISTTNLRSSERDDMFMGLSCAPNVVGGLHESCNCLRIFRRTMKYRGLCFVFSEPT